MYSARVSDGFQLESSRYAEDSPRAQLCFWKEEDALFTSWRAWRIWLHLRLHGENPGQRIPVEEKMLVDTS